METNYDWIDETLELLGTSNVPDTDGKFKEVDPISLKVFRERLIQHIEKEFVPKDAKPARLLKEKLRKALGMCNDKSCSSKCTVQLSRAMRIIQSNYTPNSELERIEREARIDENNNWVSDLYNRNLSKNTYVTFSDLNDRIAQLNKSNKEEEL